MVLLVTCLIGDMATPLCPGAFQFDPTQSIDGVRSRPAAAVRADVNAPPLPGREAASADRALAMSLPGGHLVARLPLRRPLPRAALARTGRDPGPPRTSEDG
jgi:hypothetical protein